MASRSVLPTTVSPHGTQGPKGDHGATQHPCPRSPCGSRRRSPRRRNRHRACLSSQSTTCDEIGGHWERDHHNSCHELDDSPRRGGRAFVWPGVDATRAPGHAHYRLRHRFCHGHRDHMDAVGVGGRRTRHRDLECEQLRAELRARNDQQHSCRRRRLPRHERRVSERVRVSNRGCVERSSECLNCQLDDHDDNLHDRRYRTRRRLGAGFWVGGRLIGAIAMQRDRPHMPMTAAPRDFSSGQAVDTMEW
jgi:hypothetical protein